MAGNLGNRRAVAEIREISEILKFRTGYGLVSYPSAATSTVHYDTCYILAPITVRVRSKCQHCRQLLSYNSKVFIGGNSLGNHFICYIRYIVGNYDDVIEIAKDTQTLAHHS